MAQRYEDDDHRGSSYRGDRAGPSGRAYAEDDRYIRRGASGSSRWSEEDEDYGSGRGEGSDYGRTYGSRRQSGGMYDDQRSRGYGEAGGGMYSGQSGYGDRQGYRYAQGGYGDYQSGYGQGGQGQPGRRMSQDQHYHNWRERQMQAHDEDFKAFNDERQKKFDSEFEDWRKNRKSGSGVHGSSGSGMGGSSGSGESSGSSPKKN